LLPVQAAYDAPPANISNTAARRNHLKNCPTGLALRGLMLERNRASKSGAICGMSDTSFSALNQAVCSRRSDSQNSLHRAQRRRCKSIRSFLDIGNCPSMMFSMDDLISWQFTVCLHLLRCALVSNRSLENSVSKKYQDFHGLPAYNLTVDFEHIYGTCGTGRQLRGEGKGRGFLQCRQWILQPSLADWRAVHSLFDLPVPPIATN